MGAENNKMGFKFVKSLKMKLTADEAKKRHEANLKAMEDELVELNKLVDELDKFIEEETSTALEME